MTAPAPAKPRKFWRFFAGLVVAGGLVAGLHAALPGVLEYAARQQLRALGLPDSDLKVGPINLQQFVVSGVTIGLAGEVEIPELQAVFKWSDLIKGRLGELTITDMKLRLTQKQGALSFGALDALLIDPIAKSGQGIVARWPLDAIILENAEIIIASAYGETRLPFGGRVRQDADLSVRVEDANIDFLHRNLSLFAEFSAVVERDGLLTAKMKISGGTINFDAMGTEITGGTFDVRGYFRDINSFIGEGAMTIGETTLPFGFSPAASLKTFLENGELLARFEVDDRRHAVRGTIAANTRRLFSAAPVLELTGDLMLGGLARLPQALGLPKGLTGRAALGLSFDMDFDRFTLLTQARERRQLLALLPPIALDLALNGMVLPGADTLFDADGRLDINAADGDIVIRSEDGLALRVSERRPGGFSGLLGPLFDNRHKGPARIVLREDGKPLFRVATQPAANGLPVAFNGQVSALGGGLAPAKGNLSLAVWLAPEDFSINAFALERARIELPLLTLGDAKLSKARLALDLAGSGKSFTGGLRASFLISGNLPHGIRLDGGKAGLNAKIKFAKGNLSLLSGECLDLQTAGFSLGSLVRAMEPIGFCIRGKDSEILRASVAAGGLGAMAADLTLTPGKGRIEITPDSGPRILVQGDRRRFRLAASRDAKGAITASAGADGFEVLLPEQRLRLSGVRADFATLTHTANGPAKGRLTASFDEARQVVEAPLLAPVSGRVEATIDADGAAFEGRIVAPRKAATLAFDGRHRWSNSGQATLRLHPLKLHPKGVTLSALSPAARAWVGSAAGLLMAAARLDWEAGKLRADIDAVAREMTIDTTGGALPGLDEPVRIRAGQIALDLALSGAGGGGFQLRGGGETLLEKLTLESDSLSLQEINSVIRLDSIWPLVSAAKQRVAVGLLNIGLPLTDGQIDIELGRDGPFSLLGARFALAGGRVESGPLRFAAGGPPKDLSLTVSRVDLGKLLGLFEVDGLTASGTLNGTIPVKLGAGGAIISGAALTSDGPGTLIYKPPDPEGTFGTNEYARMALDAFSDFRFKRFDMALDGAERGQMVAKLHLLGSNPEFYNSFPVQLDLTVRGRLGEILETGVTEYNLPSALKRRMLGFGN